MQIYVTLVFTMCLFRWAFTCAFCKFHTFEDKDIEKHFGSTYHRETLDYIRRQAKFDDKVIRFLHVRLLNFFFFFNGFMFLYGFVL